MFAVALVFYLYRRALESKEHRISKNESTTATTITNFARFVKNQTDDMLRRRTSAIDFSNITVPHGVGYKIFLELSGSNFRIYGIPDAYSKTGRLSFYSDNSLMTRANDHQGEPASETDPAYESSAPAFRTAVSHAAN